MVFYLSDWRTKPVGDFIYAECEECRHDVFTVLVKRRRWVSFLSLPLFPTSGAAWYHVCPECGAAWELPEGCEADAKHLRDRALALLRGEIDMDAYRDTLAQFVDDHGRVNYEEAVSEAEPEQVRYVQ